MKGDVETEVGHPDARIFFGVSLWITILIVDLSIS